MRKNKITHFMTGILILLFVGIFLLLTGRFLYIQAAGEVNNISLEEWADKKRTSSYTLPAERGKIFDNNGMTLAYDRPTFRVSAIVDKSYSDNLEEPKHVKNPEETAEVLAPLLEMEKTDVLNRLQEGIKAEKFQVEFGVAGKDLSQQLKDEIVALNIPGINLQKESIRYYPNGMFASHIIGFARKDADNEEIAGVTGIENEMNEILSGKEGHISYQRDKYNKKLLDPNEIIEQPKDGKNVHLTIDQKIQTLLEDVMSQVKEEYDPERISAAVMNAKTGEIIAMSNRPSYNPNSPSDVQNWYNDVISTPVEPGSTVKMFTWAAAIDAGVYHGDELYKSGSYQINERINPIDDHNRGVGWGAISFDEGFSRSSNVAASKLVWENLGSEKYLEYLKAFDFGEKTGIDLPGEVAGQILYNWPAEKLTTAFGQGSTLTPIQQMKAATAITNGGKMLQPYVIKKVVDPETGDILEEKSPKVVGEPISEKTAEQVIELLDSVVNSENGTGKPYRLEDYTLIGKTGTAQIPNPKGPTPYLTGKDKNIFSFLGMAPKDDPQLIMYVSVNQPKLAANELGSSPVSFIFKNVMENSLHYLDIEPDKEKTNDLIETIEVPKMIGEETVNTKKVLKEKGLKFTIIGSGEKVINTSAEAGSKLLASDRIIVITDKATMPNIIGWSHRDVHQLASLLELKVENTGSGYVVTQNIKEGKALKKNDYLKVELKPPLDPSNEKEAEKSDEQEIETD